MIRNSPVGLVSKRVSDVFLCSLALLVLMPVLAIIAVLVRVRLGSPILFRQLRPGLNSRPFMLYKFRTMTYAKDRDGKLLSDGLRLTSLGRFLRRTSLDELPELFNVLKRRYESCGTTPFTDEISTLLHHQRTTATSSTPWYHGSGAG